MTITGYSRAIVDAMLGWLKGFANWVLRLFNLAGSVGGSPLTWLSQNWLRLLIVLMIVSVAVDTLVWLVRWRPHWVWFRKLRVIVDDDRFFNESDIQAQMYPDEDDTLEKNWDERDYVVASTVVPPADRSRASDAGADSYRRSARRRDAVRRGERRRSARVAVAPVMGDEPSPLPDAERETDLFGLDGSRPGVTDFYEDEVFNVNSLPPSEGAPRTEAAETQGAADEEA